MITDNRSPQTFKILTCTPASITVQSHSSGKIQYKQHTDIPQQNYNKLLKLHEHHHPHILPVYKIQKSNSKDNITYGLYYQYYVGSLEEFISQHGFCYDQEDIVNTFMPVVQAVEFMAMQNLQIASVGLENIVITENQLVKFVDQSVIDPYAISTKANDKSKTFQELSQLIFQFLISSIKEKSPKSWKNRIQLLKQRFSKQTCTFFLSVFNKSLVSSTPNKKKKILKAKKHLEGKQNKILQPSV